MNQSEQIQAIIHSRTTKHRMRDAESAASAAFCLSEMRFLASWNPARPEHVNTDAPDVVVRAISDRVRPDHIALAKVALSTSTPIASPVVGPFYLQMAENGSDNWRTIGTPHYSLGDACRIKAGTEKIKRKVRIVEFDGTEVRVLFGAGRLGKKVSKWKK